MSSPPLFCTIIAKNYLAQARVLARSLRVHHPEATLQVLLVDEPEGLFDPEREAFRVRRLSELALPRPREFCFRYDVIELSTAVKPFLLRRLMEEGHERIVYLDPDVHVYRPVAEALRVLDEGEIVLTPHLVEPTRYVEWERNVLLTGAYNLGFLALRATPAVRRLLDWWADRCETTCLNAPERALFVDQRFMDLAPGFVPRARVLRAPEYNLARWNLSERRLTGSIERPLVDGAPLVFFHFSGFDPGRPERLSGLPRDTVQGLLAELLRSYALELREAGHATCSRWPYSYAVLSDGRAVRPALRKLFRAQPPGLFVDPFDAGNEHGFVRFAERARGWVGAFDAFGLDLERHATRWRRHLDRAALRLPAPLGRLVGRGGAAAARMLGRRTEPAAPSRGLVARLLDDYDARPELQAAFPQAFVDAHDTGPFIAHVIERTGDESLPVEEATKIRALARSRPAERLARLYEMRADVQAAFPHGLEWPGDPRFLAWLRHSGRLEHGVTEEEVLWFERSRAQHVCLRVHALYRGKPEWRAGHPLAFSRFGAEAFLAFVRDRAPVSLLPALATITRVCPPRPLTALDEVRLLIEHDPDVAQRFPRALVDGEESPALVSFLATVPAFPTDAAFVEELEGQLRTLRAGDVRARLIGRFGAPMGMGTMAEATRLSLASAGFPFLTATHGGHAEIPPAPRNESSPIPVLHISASEARFVESRYPARLAERPFVGYCTWELGSPPSGWDEFSRVFDEVWTLSTFSAAALAPGCRAPVLVFPPALEEPTNPRLTRKDFGLDPSDFVVLFMFDCQSEIERKNPFALATAFSRAFGKDDRARLVFKVTGGAARPEALRSLRTASARLPVTFLDEPLSRPDVFDLVRSCDVYASLHRSEGFGLSIAEAMRLGKPVLATQYSGNTDFMTSWNSVPVPFELVEIGTDIGPYPKGALWAEPDVEAAAASLRELFLDRDRARLLGERAQMDVARQFEAAAIGRKMAARLRLLAGRS